MALVYKYLMFSVLYKPLVFRVFASDGESSRKYALIFVGRTENSDEKTAGYLKSVTAPYRISFN